MLDEPKRAHQFAGTLLMWSGALRRRDRLSGPAGPVRVLLPGAGHEDQWGQLLPSRASRRCGPSTRPLAWPRLRGAAGVYRFKTQRGDAELRL